MVQSLAPHTLLDVFNVRILYFISLQGCAKFSVCFHLSNLSNCLLFRELADLLQLFSSAKKEEALGNIKSPKFPTSLGPGDLIPGSF